MPDPVGVRPVRPTSSTSADAAPAERPEPSPAEAADRAADAVFDARARVRQRASRRTQRIHPRALVNTSGREELPKAEQPGDIAIDVRSFLPQESLVGAFSADDRGFSLSEASRSRVHSRVVVHGGEDGFSDRIDEGAYSDRTFNPWLGKGPIINTAEPRLQATVTASDDDGVALAMHHAAADPLTPPGTPDVDVHSAVAIRRTSPEHLTVDFRIAGDGFPATEAFISDHEGNALFLGTQSIEEIPLPLGLGDIDGLLTLYGNADRMVMEGSLTVLTRPDGTFRGVEHGGQKYTLEEWNQRFEGQPALRTE